MCWKTKVASVLFGIVLLFSCQKKEAEVEWAPLLEAEELLSQLLKEDVVIVDFRTKEEYDKGHIPGAVRVWRSDIESPDYPYGGMMASATQIETLFSALGIHSKARLVLYDAKGGCDAARLWWILAHYGFRQVHLLNGGIQAWKEIGGGLSYSDRRNNPAAFRLDSNAGYSMHIDKEELSLLKMDSGLVLLDTRTLDEFTGKRQKKGAARAGRIPESIRMDWAEAVDYHGDMKFKSLEELDSLYGELIPAKETPVVTYCHSGVRSAHTTFVLTQLLGYKNVRNYDGSWTEWSHFDELPIKKDSLTLILQ